jgi:hypothetical protein
MSLFFHVPTAHYLMLGIILMTAQQGDYYQIKVKGRLGQSWSARLGNLKITTGQGETTIEGLIADQAALYGLLIKIRDLGLPLLPVRGVESSDLKG